MNLRGQPLGTAQGYAMAALLVAMSVMAILASAAMPVWKQLSTREKEEELVFRGKQYARAIGLFQRKMGPGVNPPTLDVLVQQKFLRKKYKDPITGDDFDPIAASTTQSATPGTLPGGATPAGRGQTGRGPIAPQQANMPGAAGTGRGGFGGIIGVMSKSKAESIRIYNGRTHYNEWQFVYVPQTTAPGAPGGPAGRGQRGGPSGPMGPGGPQTPGGLGRPGGPPNRPNAPPFSPIQRGPTPPPSQPPPGN